MEDIILIIQNIPNIFIYFIPGMIFLKIFAYLTNYKGSNNNSNFLLISTITSFIILTLANLIHKNNNIWILVSYTVGIAIVSSIISSFVYKSECFAILLKKIGNKTIHSSMWDEIMDDHDVFIKVYIPSDKIMYYGLYKGHEDKDDNLYILITDYDIRSYDMQDFDKEPFRDYSKDRRRWAIINTKDIGHVEVIYSKNSKRSQKPNFKN